jgi:hypothetical protein
MAGDSLRQLALVAGVAIGRVVVATDGGVMRVVRRLPWPVAAAAGVAGATALVVVIHLTGGGAAGSLGGGFPAAHGMLAGKDAQPVRGVIDS